jgi:hypothetical protein
VVWRWQRATVLRSFTCGGGTIRRPWRGHLRGEVEGSDRGQHRFASGRAGKTERTLVRLKRELLVGLDVLLNHALDLGGEDGLGRGGRVDAARLDRDDDVAAVLEEVVGVEGDDTGLVGLGNVGKDDVDLAHEHAVLVGVPSVLNDGDDVRPLLGHVDEVAARAVRELDGVDGALRTDDVSDVRNRRARGGTEVEDLLARGDVDLIETTEDTGRQLRAEGVPDAVLGLDLEAVLARRADRDALQRE